MRHPGEVVVTRTTFIGSSTLLLALAGPTVTATAQAPGARVGGASVGPTVSPYINLLRNGNTPAFNYFGLVRPQFQTNAGLQQLQQQITFTRSGPLPAAEVPGDVLVTGHAAVFMNLGGYFQSPTGAIRGPAAAPLPPPPAARLPRPGR